jgi:hypothetical protein
MMSLLFASVPLTTSVQWFVSAIAPAINAPAMMMAAAGWFISPAHRQQVRRVHLDVVDAPADQLIKLLGA